MDQYFRKECPVLNRLQGGVWGSVIRDSMMFLNGDPVDLISPEMGKVFNSQSVEKLIRYGKNLYFHHHSIGHKRAEIVSNIKGLTVQEILQDPNGALLKDVIDKEFIAASLKTPIRFDVDLWEHENYEEIIRKLLEGRFIIGFGANGCTREFVDQIRKIID